MQSSPPQNIFYKYLPNSTVDYCHGLWQQHRFRFIISPKRASKLGDYKFDASKGHHIVTVNGNLNPYSFLTTYLHEVAHLTTFKKHGPRVQPHGKEWKDEFRRLFLPLLHDSILPKEIIAKLNHYLKNPKASSCSEDGLFDPGPKALKEGESFLKDLPLQTTFRLKQRTFTSLEKRRTRIVCVDQQNGRKYLVSGTAVVTIL